MLNVAIVGYGRIAAEHAQWIRAAGLNISAVFDPTPARLAVAAAAGLPVAPTLAPTLAAALATADAALISTPTSLHADHATAALLAGKHVMVEKPMALDHAQSLALCELAEKLGKTLSVFHCRRWDEDFLAVRSLLSAGTLGKVFNIESRLGQYASCVGPAAREWRPGWRTEAAFGGGGLYDWGSHFLDQLQILLAPAAPVRVFAQLRPVLWSADCDDFARVAIDFDNGISALCEINTVTSRPLPRWHIDGTKGSASSPPSPEFSTTIWAKLEATPPAPPVAPVFHRLTERDIWLAFARACLGQGMPAVTARSVLPTMRLLDAARASSAGGRAVELVP